jgi:multidrug transporter EmrE-like cation transporter
MMQSIPAGTAYAKWTAKGASGAVLLGGVVMLRLAEG